MSAFPLLLLVAAVNLPFLPLLAYERGVLTGFALTTLLGGLLWFIWVPSGLALRLNGALAEDWSHELLRKHRNIWAVVPSLKFGSYDIDHVALSRSHVLAVETKWHSRPPSRKSLDGDAYQAAQAARTLRLSLKGNGIPEALFLPVVLLWGPGSSRVDHQTVDTPLGRVVVVAGANAAAWLDTMSTGPIDGRYAEELSAELGQLAAERDRTLQAGRVMRYLARVR